MIKKIPLISLVFKSLYRKSIKKMHKLPKKYLIIFCGIPGSGKTFIANYLSKSNYFIRVSSDDIKNLLRKKKIEFRLIDIFAIQYDVIKKFLREGYSVISDSNSDRAVYRKKLKIIAKRNKALPIVIFFSVNVDVSIERYISKRKIKNSNEKNRIANMIKSYAEQLSRPQKAIIINTKFSKKVILGNLRKELEGYNNVFYKILKRNYNREVN